MTPVTGSAPRSAAGTIFGILFATRFRSYPTKVVAGILGHSDVRMTLSVYQHVENGDFVAPLTQICQRVGTRWYEVGSGELTSASGFNYLRSGKVQESKSTIISF